jgi:hypothetical protein
MRRERVQQTILSASRMGDGELTLVPGVFTEVLPRYDTKSLRAWGVPLVIYVDCDLYSSTRAVLRFISDLVVTGTWLLFDDYLTYRGSPLHGEQKAIREWLEGNPRIGLSDYANFNGWGKAFLVYEK